MLWPGVLPSGCAGGACTYTFTLTATHQAPAGARSAFAQQTIVMNRPPRGGRLAVSPTTGFELNGTFVLRASYWVDDADDLPLRYSFYRYTFYDGNGTDSDLAPVSLGGAASLTPRLDILLPAGQLSLLVTVEDRYGATASAGADATVLPLPVIGAAVVDSVLSRAAEKLQSGDPQAATQASAALITSANAREAEGGGGLGAAEATQMRELVLEIVRDAAAATAPTAAAVGQIVSAVEAVVAVVGQVSDGAAVQASELVGGLVNASLSISESLANGTSSAVVRAVSSIFSVVEQLTATADATAAAAAADAANATTSNGTASAAVDTDAGIIAAASPPPPPPPAKLYAGLRETLSALAHAMVKGALAGEAASTALAERVRRPCVCTHALAHAHACAFPCHLYDAHAMHEPCTCHAQVQLAVTLVAPATLRGATFAAPRGSSAGSVMLPTADLGLGQVADAELSFTTLQIDTHGAATGSSVASYAASEYFDVTLSDHASLAPLEIRDAPEPIALLIPLDPALAANPEPSACNTSEAVAGLCSACDASDAKLGRHNCSGHGTCVHGRCWCDALYRGPACLQRLECRYWSEPEEAWSSSGLLTDNSSAAGAAAMAEGLLRCESNHLTEFAGFSLPTTADELLGEMQELKLVLPCEDGFFGAFAWDQNPLLYSLLLTLLLFDLVSLPFFAWRYRRRLVISRLAEQRRFYGRRLLKSKWVQKAVPRMQVYSSGNRSSQGSTTAPIIGSGRGQPPQPPREPAAHTTARVLLRNSGLIESDTSNSTASRASRASRASGASRASRASGVSGSSGTSKPVGMAPLPEPPVLRTLWSSDLTVEKHGCHTRVTPDSGGGGGSGDGGSSFSMRGLLHAMKRGRRGWRWGAPSTQVVPLSRSNSLSGRLSRTASGLSRGMLGLNWERPSRADTEDKYKPTNDDEDPSALIPPPAPPSPRSLLSPPSPPPAPPSPPSPPLLPSRPSPVRAAPPAPPTPPSTASRVAAARGQAAASGRATASCLRSSAGAPSPPLPPSPPPAVSVQSACGAAVGPDLPPPPPLRLSEGSRASSGEFSDIGDSLVEDFVADGDSGRSEIRFETCRSSFGASPSSGGAAYSDGSRQLERLESISSNMGGNRRSPSPNLLKSIRSSCKASGSSSLFPAAPVLGDISRAAPAYVDRVTVPPRDQQDGGGGGGGGSGGGRLRTISASDLASSRRSDVPTPAMAASQIQAVSRGKQVRREFLRVALRRQMEVDQLDWGGATGGATGGARSPEHRLAEAAEAAAAQARLDKSSRLRRVSASLSHRRASLLQSETVRLAQAGDWGRLGQNGASATKKGMATVTTEARNRHSVRLQYAHVHVHVHVHNVIQHAHSVRRRRHECTHLLRESAA